MKTFLKMKTSRDRPNNRQNGITIIALVITIIVLLILAGVGITYIFGDNGIIVKAQLSAFVTEMKAIKERVDLKKNDNAVDVLANGVEKELFDTKVADSSFELVDSLKKEILFAREGFPTDKSTSDYDVNEFDDEIIENLYIIDEETADGKADTYIYDSKSDVVFKIPPTSIGGRVYHSYEVAIIAKGALLGDSVAQNQVVEESSIEVFDGNEYYYSPDMSGFNVYKTYLVYYNYTEGAEDNFTKSYEVPVKEYIENGQKSQIEVDGTTYVLHNYTNKIWANAKTIANGLESWWVWIPRYAYQVDQGNKEMNIIFINTDNNPMNKEKYNTTLPEGYIPHPGFDVNGSKLYGIWMSKYEPSATYDYIPEGVQCYAPDMEGFDKNCTYIELYNNETNSFEEVKLADANLKTINSDNKWYDYPNKIWANVKTEGNGIEAWWVWIPRYAYKINGGVAEASIIFIDTNNRPIDTKTFGTTLPEGYIVHPAFTPSGEDGTSNLRGIWMSKYEPTSQFAYTPTSGLCYEPDMDGFDKDHTFIELYDSANNSFSEVKLADTNLSTINNNSGWYDYRNKIWANIKTDANNLEAWWVWIPRYAYKITNGGMEAKIIFIDLDNKPIDTAQYGDTLPEGYIVHPAFTPSGEDGTSNLKGIWMSKYEPSNK